MKKKKMVLMLSLLCVCLIMLSGNVLATENVRVAFASLEPDSAGAGIITQDVTSLFGETTSQILFMPGSGELGVTYKFNADESGVYRLDLDYVTAGDFGTYQVKVNGENAGSVINSYSAAPAGLSDALIGDVTLNAGENDITLYCTGKAQESAGFFGGFVSATFTYLQEAPATEPDTTNPSTGEQQSVWFLITATALIGSLVILFKGKTGMSR